MNIFEAYERIETIYTEYAVKVNEFISYYKENAHKKNEACISMCNAYIIYLGRQHSIDPYDEQFDENIRKRMLEARALPSYNVCNVLAWMKRYNRLEREFSYNYNQYRRAIKKAEKALDELKKQFTRKQLKNKTLMERLNSLELELMAEELGGIEWEKEDNQSAVLLRSLPFEISKNDMLSLFSLRHEDLEKKYIDELPEVIDINEFENAAFIYKLEDDRNCIFFDIYFEDMMKVLDANNEVKEKMFDTFQEVFGPIQTYTTYTDGNGNIVGMKPNKPNLKLVKMAEK